MPVLLLFFFFSLDGRCASMLNYSLAVTRELSCSPSAVFWGLWELSPASIASRTWLMLHPEALQPLSCVLDSTLPSLPIHLPLLHILNLPRASQRPGDTSWPLSYSSTAPWLPWRLILTLILQPSFPLAESGMCLELYPKPCSLSAPCSPLEPSAP